MNLRCMFGFHRWVGCKCEKCGATRNENHDWSQNCEKCAICDTERRDAHDWKGCKCEKCGTIRDQKELTCELCAELVTIYGQTHTHSDPYGYNHEFRKNARAREIGSTLDEEGGLSLMREVGYAAVKEGVDQRDLEWCWDGIGEWML